MGSKSRFAALYGVPGSTLIPLFCGVYMVTKEEKAKLLPRHFCPECITDPEIKCARDKDVKCLHCGIELCAYHMGKHLPDKHCVSTEWRGFQ